PCTGLACDEIPSGEESFSYSLCKPQSFFGFVLKKLYLRTIVRNRYICLIFDCGHIKGRAVPARSHFGLLFTQKLLECLIIFFYTAPDSFVGLDALITDFRVGIYPDDHTLELVNSID